MKPTATPVFRPTADCIWNSFRSSTKRHIIITGGRGSGKTSLLNALVPQGLPGITTRAVSGKAVFLFENATGASAQIGAFDPSLPGPENRMAPCAQGFSDLALPALNRLLHSDREWISIDEIGYLESGCEPYLKLLRRIMDERQLIAAVRKQNLPFLREICRREDVFLVDLDAPYGNLGCVIMASGLSKRFGSNKLTADFIGEPMICRAIDATEGLFARRIIVTRHEDVAHLCRMRGADVLLHALPHRSDTVRLGIEAIGDVSGCIFCAGDQPLLRRETLAALALAAANDPGNIRRTAHNEMPGMPVYFPEWTFDDLRTLPEGKGGGFVIQKYPDCLRTLPVRDGYELMDADTPEDLHLLASRIRT